MSRDFDPCARAEALNPVIRFLAWVAIAIFSTAIIGGLLSDGGLSGLNPGNPCPIATKACREAYKDTPYEQRKRAEGKR